MSISTATFFSMSACRTFTTTASPEWSVARWTWPIEAEAIDAGSKAANNSVDRPAQFGFDQLPDHLGRVGRHVGLELLKLLGQPHAHQVGPGAQLLSELDEGRPQFGQGHPQPGFPGMAGDGRPAPRLQEVLGEIRPQPADPRRQLVLAQHRHNLVPAAEVAIDLRDGTDFHGTAARQQWAPPLLYLSPSATVNTAGG